MAIRQEESIFLLTTQHSAYGLCVDCEGILRTLHWGGRLDRAADLENRPIAWEQGFHPINDIKREECSSFGTMRFKETSMKVRYHDGTRDYRYRCKGCRVQGNELTVLLKDETYALETELHYRVHEEADLIEKWRIVKNKGAHPVVLERLFSGEASLPGTGWKVLNYNGMWNSDFDSYVQALQGGKFVLESLRGATGHVANPSFALWQDAGETHGEVYCGMLAWSGNFKIVLETTPYGHLNLLAGISDTDFSWTLQPGQEWQTPSLFLGYSPDGLDRLSNTLAAFAQREIMPRRLAGSPAPVLYNSWEATAFQVNEQSQLALIEKAAAAGAELFVMDDGWFGQRQNDHAGLGDWTVNREKFPRGLTPLIQAAHRHGMRFGLWIEPEMVNRDSDLFRNHPDWVYHYKSRPVMEGRYQYMLDLTRRDVREYILEAISALLREHDISYVKWDMNRAMSEAASAQLEPEDYKSIWYRHTMAFYILIQTLREHFPRVEWEACASGGGRVDYGSMRYFDEFWPSDNTDPLDRLHIQEGYSYLYPIKYMRSWVTDAAKDGKRCVPLKFRLHCAMCGALGLGLDLNRCTAQEQKTLAHYVALYKKIRPVVQFGRLHRLASLRRHGVQAVQYEDGTESVLFAFLDHPNGWGTRFTLRLRGLQKDCLYLVEEEGQPPRRRSGAYLMHCGLTVTLDRDYDSRLIQFHPAGPVKPQAGDRRAAPV